MTRTLGNYTNKIQCPQGAYILAEKPSTKNINHDSFTHLFTYQKFTKYLLWHSP